MRLIFLLSPSSLPPLTTLHSPLNSPFPLPPLKHLSPRLSPITPYIMGSTTSMKTAPTTPFKACRCFGLGKMRPRDSGCKRRMRRRREVGGNGHGLICVSSFTHVLYLSTPPPSIPISPPFLLLLYLSIAPPIISTEVSPWDLQLLSPEHPVFPHPVSLSPFPYCTPIPQLTSPCHLFYNRC